MTDVVIVSNDEPEPENNTVVVVPPTETPTDPLLDIVTRLTRAEDAITVLSATVADISVRTDINELDTRYVMQEQAATQAAVEEVLEIATEVAETTEPEPTPTPEPSDDSPPKSKVHRFWAGKDKS